MYFVGIDISKFKHDCAIVDELGDVITPSWSFQNDREGFSLLKELLDALDGEKKIGLEATGHYGQNSQQIAQKNKDGFHRRSHDRPISDDGRVQALSTVILHA